VRASAAENDDLLWGMRAAAIMNLLQFAPDKKTLLEGTAEPA